MSVLFLQRIDTVTTFRITEKSIDVRFGLTTHQGTMMSRPMPVATTPTRPGAGCARRRLREDFNFTAANSEAKKSVATGTKDCAGKDPPLRMLMKADHRAGPQYAHSAIAAKR